MALEEVHTNGNTFVLGKQEVWRHGRPMTDVDLLGPRWRQDTSELTQDRNRMVGKVIGQAGVHEDSGTGSVWSRRVGGSLLARGKRMT